MTEEYKLRVSMQELKKQLLGEKEKRPKYRTLRKEIMCSKEIARIMASSPLILFLGTEDKKILARHLCGARL